MSIDLCIKRSYTSLIFNDDVVVFLNKDKGLGLRVFHHTPCFSLHAESSEKACIYSGSFAANNAHCIVNC